MLAIRKTGLGLEPIASRPELKQSRGLERRRMKRFPKSAAGILPRAQAGGLDLRLLNVLVLVALALALLWRGEWLGLLSLPIVAWLGSRLAAREPNVEAGPPLT